MHGSPGSSAIAMLGGALSVLGLFAAYGDSQMSPWLSFIISLVVAGISVATIWFSRRSWRVAKSLIHKVFAGFAMALGFVSLAFIVLRYLEAAVVFLLHFLVR